MFDEIFLEKLNSLSIKTQYVKIITLDFVSEKPLHEITGQVSSGNISVNGSSRVRRTLNLSMFCNNEQINLEDLDNEISIRKKIKVMIGYKNPLKKYQHYGDIVWFPCGVYIISSADNTRNTSGWTINITAKDKMAQLNGEAGGTITATTVFHERYETRSDGSVKISYPTIKQIIEEAVNHYGNENPSNIFISDLDERIKTVICYQGDQAIYFNDQYSSFSYSYDEENNYIHQKTKGDNIGYELHDFTYPGELILSPGSTVEALLNKICETLGNFEFFYDIDGRFIFQEIKNYLNKTSDLLSISVSDYARHYADSANLGDWNKISISQKPQYTNIKNDFVVWGKKTLPTGVVRNIHYRLVIDKKPEPYYIRYYLYAIKNAEGKTIGYKTSETEIADSSLELLGKPCGEWREELYRQALCDGGAGPYDAEMLAEWRDLYDTLNPEFRPDGWNPQVFSSPESINFWIDFIDNDALLQKYSVSVIGRRTKVLNSNNAKVVYNSTIPDVCFVKTIEEANQLRQLGQKVFVAQENFLSQLSIGSQSISCYDEIRELLYKHLNYNSTLTLTCFPIYYLEPNTIIYIEDKKSNISNNFLVSQFTLPLVYSGTMNITANELLSRV